METTYLTWQCALSLVAMYSNLGNVRAAVDLQPSGYSSKISAYEGSNISIDWILRNTEDDKWIPAKGSFMTFRFSKSKSYLAKLDLTLLSLTKSPAYTYPLVLSRPSRLRYGIQLFNVTHEFAGEYTCEYRINHTSMLQKSAITLEIKIDAPTISVSSLHDSYHLTCHPPVAFPHNQYVVKWYKDSQELNRSTNGTLIIKQQDSSLYQCMIVEIGSDYTSRLSLPYSTFDGNSHTVTATVTGVLGALIAVGGIVLLIVRMICGYKIHCTHIHNNQPKDDRNVTSHTIQGGENSVFQEQNKASDAAKHDNCFLRVFCQRIYQLKHHHDRQNVPCFTSNDDNAQAMNEPGPSSDQQTEPEQAEVRPYVKMNPGTLPKGARLEDDGISSKEVKPHEDKYVSMCFYDSDEFDGESVKKEKVYENVNDNTISKTSLVESIL